MAWISRREIHAIVSLGDKAEPRASLRRLRAADPGLRRKLACRRSEKALIFY
jgi:hypothetical protein